MRRLAILAVLLAAGSVTLWLVLGDSPTVSAKAPDAGPPAMPRLVIPPKTFSRRSVSGIRPKGSALPPLRLNPMPRPLPSPSRKVARANQSLPYLRLPKDLVDRKLRRPKGVTPEEGTGTAQVRKEDIKDAVHEAKAPITDCYEQALKKNPDLAGRLKVKFTLVKKDEVGRLNDASIVDEDGEGAINHPFLAICVLKALGEVEYPAPEGGDGEGTVTYPFNLAPGKKKPEGAE